MQSKLTKQNSAKELSIERKIYNRKYKLVLNRELCKNCRLCYWVCPKDAIKLPKIDPDGTNSKENVIDIDVEKCNYCGLCENLCIFNAIKHYVDEKHVVPVVETGSFPQIARSIKLNLKNAAVCPRHGKWCPLKILEINVYYPIIQTELCPCCTRCETGCPGCKLCNGVIKVKKIIQGTINLDSKKCPKGCKKCLKSCPVEALYINTKGKVSVNKKTCVYCGACLNYCPEKDAIKIRIDRLNHLPVKSAGWKKLFENMASSIQE